RAVVIRMVVSAQAGRAVVAAAGGERGLVERVDLGAIRRAEAHVGRTASGALLADPEVGPGRAQSGRTVVLHQHRVTQGRERRREEALAARVVTDPKTHVVDHGVLLWGFRSAPRRAGGAGRENRGRARNARRSPPD